MVSVIDEFQIQGELGRGNMGVVYRALDTRSGRVVALKVLALAAQAQPESAARFEQECQAAARLDHPNIVKVVKLGMSGRHPYMAMELIEGEDLDQRILRAGPLPPTEAAEIGLQIASALSHAHERGVIHRDLKPANVMLHPTRGALLTDFGLAKVFGTMVDGGLTRSSDLLGSPAYMAPEQATAQHDRVGPRTDVYGLGATLYEALTGKAPCWGGSLTEVMHAVVEVMPPPPSRRLPDLAIPPALDAICLRCLAKAPDDRYPDAEAVRHALDAYLLDPDAAGAGPDLPSWVLPVGLVLGLILLGVGGALSWLLQREPAPAPQASASPLPPLPTPDPTPSFVPLPVPTDDQRLLPGAHQLSKTKLEALLESAEAVRDQRPDDPRAHLDLARVLLGLQRHADGERAVDRALALDPQLGASYRTRGLLRAHGEPPRPVAALSDYDRALELDPNDLQARELRAVLRLNQRNTTGALEDLERWIEEAPSARAYRIRGYYYAQTKRLPFAISDYRRALELEPDHYETLLNLSELSRAHGDVRAYAEYLERCLDQRPKQVKLRKQHLSALLQLKRYREAIASSRELEKIAPDDKNAGVMRAIAYLNLKQNGAAFDTLQALLERAPNHLPALLGLAQAQMALGSWQGVIDTCDRILALKSQLKGDQLQRVQNTRALALKQLQR